MDAISELFAQPDTVMIDLPADSRETVIKKLHDELVSQPGVTDPELLLRDLQTRIQLISVCISQDAALPHARTDAVKRLMLAVGRVSGEGVAFDPEHRRIKLVFMIAVPKAQVDEYLAAMAAISRILRNDAVRTALLETKDKDEFRALLVRGVQR